jgi:hypothetical protein
MIFALSRTRNLTMQCRQHAVAGAASRLYDMVRKYCGSS